MQGSGARLTGGTITLQNGGIIQGAGLVTSSMGTSNNGVIRASGGELDFLGIGDFTNSTQSQIQVLAGSTINFMQGISSNSGAIALVGGTYENSGRTMTNAGTINGYGTLRTGGLTNNSGTAAQRRRREHGCLRYRDEQRRDQHPERPDRLTSLTM